MGTTKLVKAHLKAIRKNAYKRISKLHAWMDGVKEDREGLLLEVEREYAKVIMADELLAIIKADKERKMEVKNA
jgi:hypothetical protein